MNKLTEYTRIFFGAMIMIGWMSYGYLLISQIIPPENRSTLETMMGTFNAIVAVLIGYYFGSSNESAKKTSMLHNSTPLKIDEVKADNIDISLPDSDTKQKGE